LVANDLSLRSWRAEAGVAYAAQFSLLGHAFACSIMAFGSTKPIKDAEEPSEN
jgi:hypothetical protein